MFVGVVAALASAATRRWAAGALVVAAVASGWAASARVEATLNGYLPEGVIVLAGSVADEPLPGATGGRLVLKPDHRLADGIWLREVLPPIAVTTRRSGTLPTAGDRVVVRGALEAYPGRVRGDPVAGRIARASLEIVSGSSNPLFSVGNMLRRRVAAHLGREADPASALLSGFLIGDTSGLATGDTEALRRAGLSHFVAVSGSNVALFLAGWWLLTAPIAARPRVRAALGLVGLGVFVVVTRWEPSVVRAAVMAGIVLAGRLVGMPIDAWTALGAAVTGLLLMSGDLAASVGFQLSVFATAGVLAGAGVFAGRSPKWAWTALAATLSAQVAVMPLLLVHFGTVPLLSPLANLAAAPVVSASTVLGGVGVVSGWTPFLGPALVAANVVLSIARVASGWPQLGPVGVAGAGIVVVLVRWRRIRPLLAAFSVVALFVVAVPGGAPQRPTVTFLDVGQGDAVLLRDESGTVVLVDGGRDPAVLRSALRGHGVTHIDLLVVTHGDTDHAGGIEELVGRTPVGRIWIPDQPDLGPILPGVIAAAVERGIPVERLRTGPRVAIGRFGIRVLGPGRRYASLNDGSLVLWVESGGRSILLAGDIEGIAQRELPTLRPDILLVPHHGSATSDTDWLTATAGPDVVLSVGENTYGHPSGLVLDALRESEARIWSTMEMGDISFALE
jgi:competence protein ComEC